jgi:putative FmdB family regulatory protein
MPTYQYECNVCRNQFEQFQKFSDDPLTDCPTCDGTVRRVIQNVGVVFKGSGWYITDSRGGSKEKGASDSSSGEKPAAEDSIKTETPANVESATKSKSESATTPAPAAST